MRIAIGSDEATHLTEAVIAELRKRGLEVELHGALVPGEDPSWPETAHAIARRVSRGQCDQGILFCWTGTGVSIAANKVPGIRAALCVDAETARGARAWNDANILCMSLRLTSEEVAREILTVWLSAEVDETEKENIDRVKELDERPSLAPHV